MLLKSVRQLKRKGQALTEYALLLAGVFVVCAVAVALLGEKARDVIGVSAAVLPSAHATDNLPVQGGTIMPLTKTADGTAITLDATKLANGQDRMADTFGDGQAANLIKEVE